MKCFASMMVLAVLCGCCCFAPEAPGPKSPTPEGVTALNAAVDQGDVLGARALLKDCPALAGVADGSGGLPLHAAAFKRNAAMVLVLLDAGADVNAQKPADGWSALHFAANSGDLVTARILLDKGAQVNLRKKDGGTALHAAAMMGQKEMVELLIARGADVNARKDDGWTPLRFAAWKERGEIVQILRKNGATAE